MGFNKRGPAPEASNATMPWPESDESGDLDRAPVRLLVVEDDPIQQKAYRAVGARYGFHVTVLARAADVLRVVHQQRPEAIILDLRVEDGDTLRVLTSLRRSPETAGIPVTIISAFLMPELIDHLRDFQKVRHLAKPWTVDELLGVVEEMTGVRP
ncbi:MAG: response regulator [Myxococcota bacterium]|nr:response regulator [Myxococcota bacterium]